jgi:diguanylate cyclase (GGDEF)-like protein
MFTSAVAPLITPGERLGYVEAWTPGETAPAALADLAAITAIGQQGGLAVRNARLHSEMERQAGTDELTGLLNRRALFTELDRLLGEASAEHGQVGLLLLDVDGFKSCNDTHGHIAGDRLLRELASVLGRSIRETDLAGRYGGDEFIVILPGADAAVTQRVADRIRDHARRVALVADGITLRLCVSIGAANAREDGFAADELITAADRSMYSSKQASRADGWNVAAIH